MSQRGPRYDPLPRRDPADYGGAGSGDADDRRRRPMAALPGGAGMGALGAGSRVDGSYRSFYAWEDRRGMTVTSGSVCLKKDAKNLVGISIGGGAPYCPCLYVVQVGFMRQVQRQNGLK